MGNEPAFMVIEKMQTTWPRKMWPTKLFNYPVIDQSYISVFTQEIEEYDGIAYYKQITLLQWYPGKNVATQYLVNTLLTELNRVFSLQPAQLKRPPDQ